MIANNSTTPVRLAKNSHRMPVTSWCIVACTHWRCPDTAGRRISGGHWAARAAWVWRNQRAAGQTWSMATFGNLETTVEPLATLMREHIEIHGLVTGAQDRVAAALDAPGDSKLAVDALRVMRDLDAYMAENLVLHIAKEEDVLFPAMRGLAAALDQVVDEMVEQHDEVRDRQATLARALTTMAEGHDEVHAAHSQITSTVTRAASGGITSEKLDAFLDGLKRLDWILQGHFGDEEDDLFVPALELLSTETFEEMARQAARIEAGLA